MSNEKFQVISDEPIKGAAMDYQLVIRIPLNDELDDVAARDKARQIMSGLQIGHEHSVRLQKLQPNAQPIGVKFEITVG